MNKKRIFDIILGISIFIFILPFILIFSIVIYLTDKGNPIYVSERVGLKGKKFKIYKIRTMVINADKIGGTSTSESDKRILPIGKLIRRLKLDEFTQVINVINGTMSFVGPRPNTILDVSYYSNEEKSLLDIKPGITDYSSIIFADEGDILKDYEDPDLAYNQLIRPWKSRLGIFYKDNNDLISDLIIMLLTISNSFVRKNTLVFVSRMLFSKRADRDLIMVSKRISQLVPKAPPGFEDIITKL
tara:strand:+ start:166 stop:897 length:732 start_codon:yes stop_codon:yes gene_type:complete